MNLRLLVVLAVGIPFVLFSLWVSWQHGFVTIFSDAFTKPTHLQVFLDMCIACFVSGSWVLQDGRRRGLVADTRDRSGGRVALRPKENPWRW